MLTKSQMGEGEGVLKKFVLNKLRALLAPHWDKMMLLPKVCVASGQRRGFAPLQCGSAPAQWHFCFHAHETSAFWIIRGRHWRGGVKKEGGGKRHEGHPFWVWNPPPLSGTLLCPRNPRLSRPDALFEGSSKLVGGCVL